MIFLRLLFLIYLTDATYLYFERNSYDIYISESTPIYTKIGFIKAISSPLLSVQYELRGDTNHTFYLNSLTGELILLNPVDYETISIYKLTIEARSSPSIAPCFSELIIHIININDNSPDINLILYPSVLYESDIIKYDLNTYSTPFATITIKDLDESTKTLSLDFNDTKHFQLQFVRQIKNGFITESIYILSTKNNSQLIDEENYYLLLTACDNDQPLLCTTRSYKFHMKSNEYLCNLSFNQKTYLIDIKENLPKKTFLMHKITNKFCENLFYSIDDTKNFYIDSSTGDLFTLGKFDRNEQSIYIIQLFVNKIYRIQITVRIIDQYGNIPFLMRKNLIMNEKNFVYVHLLNSTLCRSQEIMENYFQLLSNCTIISLIKPPKGQYVFNIELNQGVNYQDTFILELQEEHKLTFKQSHWIIIIPIILSILVAIMTVICVMIIIKQRREKINERCYDKRKASPSSMNNNNGEDNSHYNKYDAFTSVSKLKVHDDHELSSSPTSTAIYLVQKASPPLSSLSVTRDDEGYSGSSDVSEHHLPFESTIISANELLEQYRIHEFQSRHSMLPLYDIPRRYPAKNNAPRISPDVSLV